jgi:DNA-binding CsgD family transcriptional regulator
MDIMNSQIITASSSLERFLKLDLIAEHNLESSVVETDHAEILWNLKFAEKLFPSCIVMLCNARHKTMDYISDNFTAILGYPCAFFKGISNVDFFAMIHPEDVESVAACFMEMVNVAMGQSQQEILAERFVMHYRIKHANGGYRYIQDEKITLESRNGRQIGLTVIKDVTAGLNFPGVKLELFQSIKNRLVKVNEYFPANQNTKVTSREAEIINLLKEGFKSQEIADRLSISIHTVKNHKKNLFKKINVRNSRELLNNVNAHR